MVCFVNSSFKKLEALQGASLTVPFTQRNLLLGTWQQIIFIDFDNRSRKREVIVQITGKEKDS